MAPFAVGLLCASCADEVGAAGPLAVNSGATELRLKPHGEPPPPLQQVLRLEVPADLRPWAVLHGKKKVGPLTAAKIPGDPHGVLIIGKGKKTLAIPGSFPTHTFNRVVVELVTPAKVTGRLSFHFQGSWKGELSATLEGGGAELRELVFEPERLQLTPGRCQGLRFDFDSPGPCFVTAVSFWRVPLTAYAPDCSKGPARVEIEGDRRDAFVLSSTRYLRASFDVSKGAVLRFGYGLLSDFRGGRDRLRIEVRIESGRGTRTFRNYGFNQPGARVRWNAVEIPLDEHVGRRARLRIEIEPSRRGERLAVIGEPRLIVPQRSASTVLLVTSDSFRADHLGTYTGGRAAKTPHLDRLVDRGLLFDDCLAIANESCTSYAALMTGTRPLEWRSGPIPEEVRTLAEVFASCGWTTVAAISSPELAPDETGLGRGFGRILSPGEQRAPARIATRWLRTQLSQLDGEPLFAWLHLSDAALPYEPPALHRRLFLGREFDKPDPRLPAPVYPIVPLAEDAGGKRAKRYLNGLYKAEVNYLDKELGALLGEARILAGTVAFTADHGESLGEHGVWYSAAGLYPQTLRVPLILSWPSAPRRSRIGRPITPLDLGRTLLNLARLEGTAFPGEDLRRPRGGTERADEPRFALGLGGRCASITHEQWHLVLHLAPKERPECSEREEPHSLELYHLQGDGGCQTDLAPEELDRAIAMRERLVAWLPEGSLDPQCDCRWCVKFGAAGEIAQSH